MNRAQGKAKLITQRDFARSTGNAVLLAAAEVALLEFGVGTPPSPSPSKGDETEQERMKKVNEKNRAMNREEIRRAEGKAQDERRRLADKLARGVDVKVDASARVKTMTRLKYDRFVFFPFSFESKSDIYSIVMNHLDLRHHYLAHRLLALLKLVLLARPHQN